MPAVTSSLPDWGCGMSALVGREQLGGKVGRGDGRERALGPQADMEGRRRGRTTPMFCLSSLRPLGTAFP